MNLDKIFRDSINEIKSKWILPKTGFLSGGSIANLVWEKVSGNKAVINDIDIYHLYSVIDKADEQELRQKQNFQKKDKIVYEDYSGITVNVKLSSFYIIEKVSTTGILNEIEYKSNTEDPQIIIESFDINCCQIGYDLSKDKFYWTKEFEEFLTTGEIKLINLSSPAHSAMRLVKKQIDLNAKLPELELDIIAYTLKNGSFLDTTKHRFKQRYADMFEKYMSGLESRFELVRDEELEIYLQTNKNVHDKMYVLKAKVDGLNINPGQKVGLLQSKDFLFWIRNIFGNYDLEKMWYKLHLIFDYNLGINYLDCKSTEEEVNLINRLTTNAPDCVRHLNGFTLSRQLYIVKTLFDKFKDDPIIAISILETYCIDYNVDIENEMDLLLLELSVRKKILDDPRDKVRKILQTDSEEYRSFGSIDILPFQLG
jgi:hypothetical protein